MDDIQSKLPEEKEWWDKRKEGIQSQYMKELDDEAAGSRKGSVVSVPGQKSSDEDAVLIETPGSAKKKGKN